jgi:hypothetical protein
VKAQTSINKRSIQKYLEVEDPELITLLNYYEQDPKITNLMTIFGYLSDTIEDNIVVNFEKLHFFKPNDISTLKHKDTDTELINARQ